MLKILFIIILLCTGCTSSLTQKPSKNDFENQIIIEQIKINSEFKISSIKEEVNGIVIFSEYGRPDIEGSNTVIGAHSGYGENAYFNLLDKLSIGEEIVIYYKNVKYKYLVKESFEVVEKDTSPLNKKEWGSLTLITCKLGDSSKRIIVVASIEKVI